MLFAILQLPPPPDADHILTINCSNNFSRTYLQKILLTSEKKSNFNKSFLFLQYDRN